MNTTKPIATYEPRTKVYVYTSSDDAWHPGRVIRTELDGIRVAVYQPMPTTASLVNLHPRHNVRPRYDGQEPPKERP